METYSYLGGTRTALRCTKEEQREDDQYWIKRGFIKVIRHMGQGRYSYSWEKKDDGAHDKNNS